MCYKWHYQLSLAHNFFTTHKELVSPIVFGVHFFGSIRRNGVAYCILACLMLPFSDTFCCILVMKKETQYFGVVFYF